MTIQSQRFSPLQGLDGILHGIPTNTEKLDPHLFDVLQRAWGAKKGLRPARRVRTELASAWRLKTDMGVFATGRGTSPGIEDGRLDRLEMGMWDGEDELETFPCHDLSTILCFNGT